MANKFQHRAGAYGISGKFLWPISDTINIRPSVDLPPEGGFGKDVEENFNFHNLVRFSRGYTEVSGSPNEEPRDGKMVPAHNNLSLAVIEDFDLLSVVEIKKMVSRITTRYFEGDKEIEIVLTGTRFEGFRVLGHEVIVKLATDLYFENPTPSKLRNSYNAGGAFRDRYHTLSNSKPVPRGDEYVEQTTLVEKIIVPDPTPEFSVYRNVIDIPHVGKLFLAELDISHSYKSLNLIRWELGCPSGGSGGAGGGEGGGVTP
jgi:hypothetical protein